MIKKFFTLLCLCSLCIGSAWGETYTKVTSVTDGVYLIVNETSNRLFNGVDAANGYVECKISNGSITSNDFEAYEVTIETMDGGYSLKLSESLGTDKAGNYIYGKSGSNSIQYGTTAVASTITINNGAAKIENNSTYFCYNSTSGNDRFRFYKSTTTGNNYIIPALYKKEPAPTVKYKVTLIDTNEDITEEEPGSGVQLPTRNTIDGYTFAGWCTEKLTTRTTTAPSLIPAGTYKLISNISLYPVYTKTEQGEESWHVANNIKSGDVVIISTSIDKTTASMRTAGTLSSSLFSCVNTSTYSDNNTKITNLGENTLQFTVEGDATKGWAFRNGDNYLKMSGDKKVAISSGISYWNVSFSEYNAKITQSYNSKDYSIQYNYNDGNDRFTGYSSAQQSISLFKRFTDVIYYCPPPVVYAKMTSNGYATFSSNYTLDLTTNLPENFKAYKATVNGNVVKMNLVSDVVKANTGLFLKGEKNRTYAIPVAGSTGNELVDNDLLPTTGSELAEGSYVYVIESNDFRPLAKETIVSKGKAYIEAKSVRSAKGDLEVIFGEPTSIEQVSNIKTENNKMYNLQGVQVNKDYNGIVIMCGKKYLNK